jgi:hypothetical protein
MRPELAVHRDAEQVAVVGDVAVERLAPEIGAGLRSRDHGAGGIADFRGRIQPAHLADQLAGFEPGLAGRWWRRQFDLRSVALLFRRERAGGAARGQRGGQ